MGKPWRWRMVSYRTRPLARQHQAFPADQARCDKQVRLNKDASKGRMFKKIVLNFFKLF